MRPIIRDFLTGITTIAGLAGLTATLMLFGELSDVGETYSKGKLIVGNAGGIGTSSPVLLHGVKIGDVVGSRVTEPRGAELLLRIRSTVKLPRKAEVILQKGLVGPSVIEFTIPETLTPEELADVIQEGFSFDGGKGAAGLSDQLSAAVAGPLAKLETTAAKIDAFADTYTKLGESLREMVEPRTLADVAAGKAPNIRTTLERVDIALESARSWMNDPALRDSITSITKRADDVLAQAESLVSTWTQTGKDVSTAAAEAKDDVTQLVAEAKEALATGERAAESLAAILERINKGEGTAGQLVNNPDLYNSLADAATRLDAALREFQLLAEKYRTEGLPIKFR